MKTKKITSVVLMILCASCLSFSAYSQTQPLGTVIGHQTVVSIPVAPPGYSTAQALVYYPDDYFLPQNANKKYPLYIFLHGAGEGSSANIAEVNNTSLPNLIAGGLKPYGIDPSTGDTIKWIIVSPHCAGCGGSYSYPQLQYTIPYLFTAFNVDTSCVWVGGLSSGARGTWSVVMGSNVGDTALGKRICGIMPMANGGYDNQIVPLGPNLDTIARRGLGVLYTIGNQDPGYNAAGFSAYDALLKQYSQPGRYFDSVVINGTHSTNVWNPPFPETARIWSKTMNSWTQMWTMRKTAAQPSTLSADAGSNIVLYYPANSTTLNGTGTVDPTGTITTYTWSKVSGPSQISMANMASPTPTISNLTIGIYVFKLAVTDNKGANSSSQTQVLVTTTLPIAFDQFTGENKLNANYLNWQTSMDDGYYNVEKSNDGKTFTSIAKVYTQHDNSATHTYSYLDEHVAEGLSYYRIQNISLSGTTKYSSVVALKSDQLSASFSYYPNPVKDKIVIKLESDETGLLFVRLIGIDGRVVFQRQEYKGVGSYTSSIDFGKIPSGVYFISLSVGDKLRRVGKIVKE